MGHLKPISFLLLISLLGCNSETAENANNDNFMPSQQNLHALNGIGAIRLNTTEQIDLSNFIIKSTSENVEITHFDNLNPSMCPDIAPANLGFEINSDTLGRCDYRYHVTNAAGERDSAIYSVLTSSDGLSTLATINQTIKIDLAKDTSNQTSFSINLDDHIDNVEGLNGLEINPDTLKSEFSPTIASAESLQGAVVADSIENRTIKFTTPNELGWFYITYTLREIDTNGNLNAAPDSKAGYIFINITDNVAPVINAPQCIINQEINNKEDITIDLANITTDDNKPLIDKSGDWQLSYVFSPNGLDVTSSDPSNVLNKSFTFNEKDTGNYEIIYTVSDHQNGFALGMMKITVADSVFTEGALTCSLPSK